MRRPCSITNLAVSLCFILACVSGFAPTNSDPLKISIGTIPFVLHERKPGPHNEVFQSVILESVLPTYKINMVPHYRANRDFLSRQSDCLYITVDDPPLYPDGSNAQPLLPSAAGYNDSIRFSQSINQIKLHTYSREGEPIIHSYDDMEGQVIIGVRTQLTNIQDRLRRHGAIILYIEDYTKGFQLLDRGRADAIISYSMDVQVMLEAERAEVGLSSPPLRRRYSYDKDFAIRSVNEIAACWRSPEADRFIDRINTQINLLRNNGNLDTIFADYQ